jgi:hypothetical protein
MLSGDVDTGKTIVRDCMKAMVGFEKFGRRDRRAAQKPGLYRGTNQAP